MSTATTQGDKPLAGKVALVTGSTTGLGLRIYRQLAALGATVYIAGRNEEAGHQAAQEFPGAAVYVKMDLSTVRLAHKAARDFLESGVERLDILVNNAAQLASWEYALNEDGVFGQMVTNHFGHFVLTQELLQLMEKTAQLPGADVRIITIGSGSYHLVGKDRRFDSLDAINAGLQSESTFGKMERYGVSKLAQCLYTRELARRLRDAGSPITALVVDPGAVGSEGGVAGLSSFPLLAQLLFKLIQTPPERAAHGVIWASTLPPSSLTQLNGRVVERSMWSAAKVGPASWTDLMADGKWEKLAQELWETSEKLVKERLAGVKEGEGEGEGA